MSAFPALARAIAGGTAYADRGSGEPLVLIHGVGMRAEAWTPQIAHFSRSRRVVALDLPGHGMSAPAPAGATLAHYVDAAAGLIETLDLSRVALAGHSLGALVAIGVALERPDRIASLIAFNAVYCRDPESRRAVERRADEIAASGSVGDVEVPLARWFGTEPDAAAEASREAAGAWLQAVDPAGYAAAYGAFARSDEAHRGRLGALAIPALFATGDLDPNSTPAMSRAMAMAAPRGEALVLEGSRHMMNLVEADAVNAMMDRFLARP